jgi:hypothetical protein
MRGALSHLYREETMFSLRVVDKCNVFQLWRFEPITMRLVMPETHETSRRLTIISENFLRAFYAVIAYMISLHSDESG